MNSRRLIRRARAEVRCGRFSGPRGAPPRRAAGRHVLPRRRCAREHPVSNPRSYSDRAAPGAHARVYAVAVTESALPSVAEILAQRSGEELDLNDAFLNPQMGRILRTLGFDKSWREGEGAHLIDATGERYLDLFGGYGVFAIGRNHPDAVAGAHEGMRAEN